MLLRVLLATTVFFALSRASAVVPVDAASLFARSSTAEHTCKSGEFYWSERHTCLPKGGPSHHQSPPSGKACPPKGWTWSHDEACCTPKDPNPPKPECPHSWNWSKKEQACYPPTPTTKHNHPSSTPHPHKPSSTPHAPQPSHHSGTKRSPQSHKGKRDMKSREPALCPNQLSACPIRGMLLMGDYECLDVKEELQSCGGCVSIGEGQDCTAIAGSWNVGCEMGSCAGSCGTWFKKIGGILINSFASQQCIAVCQATSARMMANRALGFHNP